MLLPMHPESNNRTERNYSSYAEGCLAAVWGVSHFRVYLYGRRFVLLTDHEPLEWLMTNEKLTGMHARWAHILSEGVRMVRWGQKRPRGILRILGYF
jgi:hypothetical protein